MPQGQGELLSPHLQSLPRWQGGHPAGVKPPELLAGSSGHRGLQCPCCLLAVAQDRPRGQVANKNPSRTENEEALHRMSLLTRDRFAGGHETGPAFSPARAEMLRTCGFRGTTHDPGLWEF